MAFIGLGFLVGSGDMSHFGQKAVRTVDTPLFQQFAISLFWIYVSYSGWNAATYVAEEIKQPGKTLPKGVDVRNRSCSRVVYSAEHGIPVRCASGGDERRYRNRIPRRVQTVRTRDRRRIQRA